MPSIAESQFPWSKIANQCLSIPKSEPAGGLIINYKFILKCANFRSLEPPATLLTSIGLVCLVGFLTYSSTTRLYRGRAPRQSFWQFYVLPHMRQSWETMTSVSAGHIILTPTQPVADLPPQISPDRNFNFTSQEFWEAHRNFAKAEVWLHTALINVNRVGTNNMSNIWITCYYIKLRLELKITWYLVNSHQIP